jgi:uncharacterized membrane protein YphA (DoxX/SURF4 family)
MRRIAFLLAVLAGWTVLVLVAAGVDVSSPFAPAEQRAFRGDDFTAVFGTASVAGDRLNVSAPGEGFTSLQSLHPPGIDAEALPTLRYRFADFPRTLELSLVIRTAETPEDIAISLPWPGDRVQTFDLSRVPEWRGRIVEIGFAEFPTAQVVPPALGFKPFAIVEAGLWSRSWGGDLAALATDWFAAWPWTQRSVHALGRDTETPHAPMSLVLTAALAAGISIACAALAFGRRARPLASAAAIALAVAWLALDVAWQFGLWGRLETTRAVYAKLSWNERQRTVADADLAALADRLRIIVRTEPQTARILVYGDAASGYELLRFIWHVLPRNIALLVNANVGDALPNGSLIVFLRSDAWRTNPGMRSLLAASDRLISPVTIHADSFEDEPVVVFRYRHGK